MTNAQDVIKDATSRMDGALAALKDRFSGLRTGKASPSLVDSLQVPYYGVPTRLKDMANISTPEARQITIAPFDPSVLNDIEKAILAANLGVTPRNDGRMIRIMMPELTEEIRSYGRSLIANGGTIQEVTGAVLKEFGLFRVELAELLGVNHQRLSEALQGNPRPMYKAKFAEFFGE